MRKDRTDYSEILDLRVVAKGTVLGIKGNLGFLTKDKREIVEGALSEFTEEVEKEIEILISKRKDADNYLKNNPDLEEVIEEIKAGSLTVDDIKNDSEELYKKFVIYTCEKKCLTDRYLKCIKEYMENFRERTMKLFEGPSQVSFFNEIVQCSFAGHEVSSQCH